jgi:hypothetical protein
VGQLQTELYQVLTKSGRLENDLNLKNKECVTYACSAFLISSFLRMENLRGKAEADQFSSERICEE